MAMVMFKLENRCRCHENGHSCVVVNRHHHLNHHHCHHGHHSFLLVIVVTLHQVKEKQQQFFILFSYCFFFLFVYFAFLNTMSEFLTVGFYQSSFTFQKMSPSLFNI